MNVRAKLKLTQIKETHWTKQEGVGSPTRVLRFDCQYDQTIPEDQRFQKATPSGHIELQIDNPAALARFELGKEYYVDFSPVE